MLGRRVPLSFRRLFSTEEASRAYQQQLDKARVDCLALLNKYDRSSFLLSHYVPEPIRDSYTAIKAFNVELKKVSDGASTSSNSQPNPALVDIKLKFWEDLMVKIFTQSHSNVALGEPIATLLREGLKQDQMLDLGVFQQIISGRSHYVRNEAQRGFANIDAICSFGESTDSQVNYALQGLLLSPSLSPAANKFLELVPSETRALMSEIAAHIGQSTSLASVIVGLKYFAAAKNRVLLPLDLMAKHGLSQESVLRIGQGHEEPADVTAKLQDVVFDVSVAANDHLMTARNKFDRVKESIRETIAENRSEKWLTSASKRWRHKVSDVIFVPYMAAVPTELYLERLEKYNFNVLHPKLATPEWRLAWRSYRNYNSRSI
ncbi:unnamed protein product [Kuraishia capsulata CBS 1993]|uniref:NADH dehydrogenase (Ubiquinone) complex I, assembly factor 6 n=1 Tax=Kuraishia capsulata CBS 1993 TaxID=1382522 RepID=W6MGY1_9ASCO|nr:uncharacterized protein KUCA_T00001128001 [Kuraishia capsulata CBS 1993]CDK25161.1 unnamed protein product [Kuraishia capsulata CBS 1993]